MTARSFLIAVLLLAARLAGSGPTVAAQSTPETAPWPFPGLYLADGVVASVTSGSVSMISTLPCAALLNMLAASEWTMTERDLAVDLSGHETGEVWAVIRRETSVALVKARDDGGCQATIDLLSSAKVTASGAVSDKETALAYPIGCAPADNPGTWQIMVGFEGKKNFRAVVILKLQATPGSEALTAENVAAGVGSTSQSLLAAWFGAARSIADPSLAAGIKLRVFQAGGGFSGTATIATADPPSGTFKLQGLISPDGATEAISGSFACPPA
jgi:hypothetical protein